MAFEDVQIDGFILPGHVSVIIGVNAYQPFYERHQIPCVIAGFEPADILQAIGRLVELIENGSSGLENAYRRAVTVEGNTKAQKLLDEIGIGAKRLSIVEMGNGTSAEQAMENILGDLSELGPNHATQTIYESDSSEPIFYSEPLSKAA